MTDETPKTNPPQQETPIEETAPQEWVDRLNEIYTQWLNNELEFEVARDEFIQRIQEGQTEESAIKQALAANNLGILYGMRGEFRESVSYFQQARDDFAKSHNTRRAISADLNMGETYRLSGNLQAALQSFMDAYQVAREMQQIRMQAIALTNAGQVHLANQDYSHARDLLNQALELTNQAWEENETERTQTQRTDNKTELYHALAELELAEGNLSEAWHYAKETLRLATEVKRTMRLGLAERTMGDVVTELDAVEDGYDSNPDSYYERSLDYFRDGNNESELARTYLAQGKSQAKRGKKRTASTLLQQAMVIFTKLSMNQDAAAAANEQMKLI